MDDYLCLYPSNQMLVPECLYHTAENPFELYGFKYKTMAHWFAVQDAAYKGEEFHHLFDKDVSELPRLKYSSVAIIEEGIEAMLQQNKHEIRGLPNEYACSHPMLGIGTTKLRMEYGDKGTGRNLYGRGIERVLKRRRTSK